MKITQRNQVREVRQALGWLGMGIGAWLFASCATPNMAPSAPAVMSDAVGEMGSTVNATPKSKVERTGIATGWGREVGSAMTYTDFVRASDTPGQISTIRYNDKEGAQSMGVDLRNKSDGMMKAGGGNIEWGMTSGWGSLENYWWRGGRFVVGKKGREYEIKIRNPGNSRIEAVLSVDGLDVIDGKSASTKKRGYIVNPYQTLVVKGFRTSHEAVASFKFSSVSGSYANLRHGETRNVGVVGIAIFYEKGATPWIEANQRGGARAFAEAPAIRARD